MRRKRHFRSSGTFVHLPPQTPRPNLQHKKLPHLPGPTLRRQAARRCPTPAFLPLFFFLAQPFWEAKPPAGVEPLDWILLTSVPTQTLEEIRTRRDWYACRWMIEDYHKAMKSGCGIEELQMTSLHGLSNAIALLSVLAVHVLRFEPVGAHDLPLAGKRLDHIRPEQERVFRPP